MNKPLQLIEDRGVIQKMDGTVIDCVTSWDGQYSAFTTAEGDLWIIPVQQRHDFDRWQQIHPHDGGILFLAGGMNPSGFITSGDDKGLMQHIYGHASQPLLKASRWVDKGVTWLDDSGKNGQVALIVGKEIHLYKDGFSESPVIFEHSSSISDLVFSLDGNRLASAYYNGATLWSTIQTGNSRLKDFIWKGSHIGVALHPQEQALVTAMQDHDLHGWRIADGHNMRMSGYPQKVKSLSFSADGKWLATSGAESVVLWPFFDGGPIGKPPVELPGIPGSYCTRVAFHPVYDMVAAGFLDGSVLLISVSDEKVIPVCLGSQQPVGEISALCFNRQGSLLCFGTETGTVSLIDLS